MLSATREVRVERVVLEHHRDVAILRRELVHDAVADRDRPVGDAPRARRPSAARSSCRSPEGPTRTRNSPSANLEREVLDGVDAAVVDLVDLFELHLSHCRPPSSSHESPDMERRPVRRERGVISSMRNVLAVQRVERRERRAGRAGQRDRSCAARRRQAEQPRRRAPRARRRSRPRRRARSGSRRARARGSPAQRDQPRYPSKQRACPTSRARPRHRAARVLAPLALEADLVAREDHRHAGRRHLQPDADELALARARDRREARRVVAVEERPRVERRRPRNAGAERPHRADDRWRPARAESRPGARRRRSPARSEGSRRGATPTPGA